MIRQLLILCCGFVLTDIVSGSCRETGELFPKRLRISEDKTGTQFSVPYNSSDTWTLEVSRINSAISTPQRRRTVLGFFNLTLDDNTNLLTLSVAKELDLEAFKILLEMDVSSIELKFKCGSNNEWEIPVLVDPVDEFPPEFVEKPYSVSIPENTRIRTSVFNVKSHVRDKDVRRNGGFNYYIEEYRLKKNVDGLNYFEIPYSSQGIVRVKRLIDFDSLYRRGLPTYFILNLTAEGTSSFKSWTTLNITIVDEDDQGPVFSACTPPCRAQYTIHTQATFRGIVHVSPFQIRAEDPDSFNNSIVYSLEQVPYLYRNAFSIDRSNGKISQSSDVYSAGVLTVKATEDAQNHHEAIATVLISLGNDTSNPTPAAKIVKEDSDTLRTAIIILAVIALFIIIGIIIVFVVYHKKVAKAVRPKDDGTEASLDISHSQNWPAMSSGSKTELLADEMLNAAYMASLQGRGNTLPPLTRDSATTTGKKRSRRRNKNKEPEIFDGTREYEGKLDLEFFNDANTKSKIKQSTRSKDTKTDPKYWITIPNDDE